MNKRNWNILCAVMTALSLIATVLALVLGGCSSCVETAAGSCVPMKCHWTFQAVILFELLAAVAAGLGFTTPGKHGRVVCALMAALASACTLIAFYTPLMGLCAAEGMACRQHALVVSAFVAAVIVCAIIGLVRSDPAKAARPKKEL